MSRNRELCARNDETERKCELCPTILQQSQHNKIAWPRLQYCPTCALVARKINATRFHARQKLRKKEAVKENNRRRDGSSMKSCDILALMTCCTSLHKHD